MKMNNKKFVAIATTLGLGASLLSGCASGSDYDDDDFDYDKKKKDESYNGTGASGTYVPIVTNSGSKGIGSAKGGSGS